MKAVDPITLEILQNKLLSDLSQITHRLVRAGRSFMIKEMEDCSASLFDANCRLLAESANIPIHLNCVGICLRAVLDRHLPSAEWRRSDVVLTNDPYLGGGSLGSAHTDDLVMYAPAFVDNALVGLAGVMAHHLDIGVRTMATRGWNVDIQQEGLLIPPVKLVDRGRINSAVLQMVLRNTRVPEVLENGLLAQLSSLVAGGSELTGIFTEYCIETMYFAVEKLIRHAETRSRQEIAAIPDGVCRGEVPILDDGYAGGPRWLRLEIRKTREEIEFDFTGTDPQIRGPVNAPLSTTMSAIYYVMRCLTDPALPKSEGCKLPNRVTAPEGTLVNARPPAAVYQRMVTCHWLVDLVMGTLAEAVPERVTVYSCGSQYNYTSGFDVNARRWFRFGEITPGGLGATSDLDGIDVMAYYAIPPIEATEIEWPVLFLRREYRQDSGGAGYRPGGMGQAVAYKVLAPEAEFTHTSQESRVAPRGFAGGLPGACGRWVIIEGMPDERTLEYAMGHVECLKQGNTVTFYATAVGGFGDPRRREREKVVTDLLDGLISGSVVRDVYGYAELCPEREVG